MTTELESKPWAGKIFVDGEFRDAEGAAASPVMDKGRGELTSAGVASPSDLEGAVSSARAAQRGVGGQADVGDLLLRQVAQPVWNGVMRSPS